jgi:hypothetical protein
MRDLAIVLGIVAASVTAGVLATLVLLNLRPARVSARWVEDEDGVQPVDPYITTRWFPDGSWRYEPVSR